MNGTVINFQHKSDFADFFKVSENTVEMWLQQRCKPKKSFGIKQVYVDGLLILDFSRR